MADKSTNDAQAGDGEPIIIKKYANRRLYNTGSSSYITLDDLAVMVRENVDFKVLDAKSGDEITHAILTQIIMDEEASGKQMLPVGFLRELIAMYGNSMQSLMPSYLEASMANFRENQAKISEAFGKGMSTGPISAIHETNMAMMRAATEAFIPGAAAAQQAAKQASQDKVAEDQPAPADQSSSELAEMRAQMAAMQKKLDELSK